MKALHSEDLQKAYDGSYYTILGTDGPLDDWVNGYEGLLHDKEIGAPREWFTTTGESLNAFAAKIAGGPIIPRDRFKSELIILLFPLTDLHVGRLAIFKIAMQDRWFDDIIDNMEAEMR
jgi:hypothetical protein